jgi:hypothetical protein
MTSTEKGTAFEDKVFGILNKLLVSEAFFITGRNYKIYRHKKYFSLSRQADIIIDLSIEFSRAIDSKPNLFILVECKDYNKTIPVDDIEEFYSKTQQITGVNVKSILFTTTSLQSSAFNFAASKGISVVRILDDDSLTWLIERTNKNLTTDLPNSIAINVINALTNEYFVSTRKNIFCFCNEKTFLDIKSVLLEIISNSMEPISEVNSRANTQSC